MLCDEGWILMTEVWQIIDNMLLCELSKLLWPLFSWMDFFFFRTEEKKISKIIEWELKDK